MQIKHLCVKPGTFVTLQEDDWFIVQTMLTAKAGHPMAYVVMVRGQSKELLDFIRSYKMASADELAKKLGSLIPEKAE